MHYRIQHFKEGNNYSTAARHLTLYICFVYWEIPVDVFSFTYSYAVDKVLAVTNAAVTHCIVPGEDEKFLFEEHTLLKQSNVSLSVIWNSCTCHLIVGFLPPRAHAPLGANAVISVETANEGQQSAYAWLNSLTKLSLDLVNMYSLHAMHLNIIEDIDLCFLTMVSPFYLSNIMPLMDITGVFKLSSLRYSLIYLSS